MNVVFLDIDGPLLPGRAHWLGSNTTMVTAARKKTETPWFFDWELKKTVRFDPIAVHFFNAWVGFSDARIVISSNWTGHTSKEQLRDLFNLNGLVGEFYEGDSWETTKHFRRQHRAGEINEWLLDHPDVTNFLIVDDDPTVKDLEKDQSQHKKRIAYCKKKNMDTDDRPYVFKDLIGHVIEVSFDDGITLAQFQQGLDILKIDIEDILETWYGVKKLTPAEKAQKEREYREALQLLSRSIC